MKRVDLQLGHVWNLIKIFKNNFHKNYGEKAITNILEIKTKEKNLFLSLNFLKKITI